MSESTGMTVTPRPMLLPKLAAAAGLEPAKFYAAIKATCGCSGAGDEHFAVLMMVADQYNLNPMLKQLYLMETKKGVQAVIPVDGWVPLLVNYHEYLAHDVVLIWDGEPFKSKCVAATCRIWTKTRQKMLMGPFEHSEMMEECYRDTGPWKSHPTRMLGHKAVIQATRRAFGIYVMDEDEARNIGEVRALPSEERSFRLPTGEAEPVIEAESVPAVDQEAIVDTETVEVWRMTISFCDNVTKIEKLLKEYDEVRPGINDATDEAIMVLFGEQRLKVEGSKKGD